MIPNQWYVVLESRELGKKPIGVTRLGEKLVFFRSESGKAICLADKCAHRGVALSFGRTCDDDTILCPFHGLRYDASGKCRLIPANGKAAVVPPNFKVRSYPTHEDQGFIWIWWGEAQPSPPVPEFFDDIPGNAQYATVIDPWDAHYSRVIENQIDCVHLPFVHHNTIGRGNKTLVNGPGFEWAGPNKFFVYVYNEVDSGQKPKTPTQVPIPNPNGFKLEFIYPNLWENRIADKVRVLGAFVPVDGEHTLLYLRFYQAFALIPVIGSLIAQAAMAFNRIVAHQDRVVVQTQMPKASGLGIGENLFQGDKPIMEYRKRRNELQKKAEDKAL